MPILGGCFCSLRGYAAGRRNLSNILPVGTGVSNAGGAIRMNGFGRNGTYYSVDGVNASGNAEQRSASTYGASDYIDIMSIEGIAEVQTIKGVVPAEYGDALGGHVNVITKSGIIRCTAACSRTSSRRG